MALPSSGPMTAAMINAELGRSATAPFRINGVVERALAERPSGAIAFSDFYGKAQALLKTTIRVVRQVSTGVSNTTSVYRWTRVWSYGMRPGNLSDVPNPYIGNLRLTVLQESMSDQIQNAGGTPRDMDFTEPAVADNSRIVFSGNTAGPTWGTVNVGGRITTRASASRTISGSNKFGPGRQWDWYSGGGREILGRRRSGTYSLTFME